MVRMGRPSFVVRLVVRLGAASAICAGLLLAHSLDRGTLELNGLPKNLALAWIPLLLSLLLLALRQRGVSSSALAPVVGIWLLFLPNAPYIATDFVHVSHMGGWETVSDAIVVGAFALTGLAFGFASAVVVHRVVTERAGGTAGWICVVSAIGLSGVGVYLGRVHRLNSWDAIADPSGLAGLLRGHLADPLAHGSFYVALAGYTLVAALVYVPLYRATRRRIERGGQGTLTTTLGST